MAIKTICAAILITSALAGCSKGVPKCDDPEVLKTVYSVAGKRYVSNDAVTFSFIMKSIRQGKVDKETKVGMCQGELHKTMDTNPTPNPNAIIDYDSYLGALSNNSQASGITKLADHKFLQVHSVAYKVEMTTDGAFTVSVLGLEQ